jgi:hypothetical protein
VCHISELVEFFSGIEVFRIGPNGDFRFENGVLRVGKEVHCTVQGVPVIRHRRKKFHIHGNRCDETDNVSATFKSSLQRLIPDAVPDLNSAIMRTKTPNNDRTSWLFAGTATALHLSLLDLRAAITKERRHYRPF